MEPFIGQIMMFGGNFAPRGWALCDGQLLSISENQALFSLLGTTYGGDGRTTFGLPDLRGRFAMHAGNGPGLGSRPLGQKSGTETNTLTVNNLPSHTHTAVVGGSVTVQTSAEEPDTDSPSNAFLCQQPNNLYNQTGTPGEALGGLSNNITVTNGNTGNNTAVNNLQPYQCVNYIIALTGIFPSRS